ncbi:unnamed protein product [Urochloa humidicola]
MNTTTTSNPMFVPTETFSHKLDELLQLVREMSAETISPQLSPPPSPPTATTSVINNDVFTSDLAAMKQDLERRLQRLEEMFPSTPRTSSPPSPTSSIPIAPTPPSSTTPSTPTPSAPTSIDTTTLIPTATREPLHPPPARCSTLGRSRDERALAPVLSSTSPLQASALVEAPVVAAAEEEVFTTTPAKCSTYCLSSKFRYFTISIPTHQIEVRLPCLASKVYDAQTIFERATDQYPVLLWSTFNGYWDFLLGKGPWPPPQLCFSFGLSFSGNWIDAQQRPPWPPPILSEFMDSNGLVECSKASCVFDRGKSGEGNEYTLPVTFNGAQLQVHVAIFLLQAKSVNLQVEMVHCNNLMNAGIQLINTMVCGSVSQPRVQPLSDTQLFWCCQMNIQFKIPRATFYCSVYGLPCNMLIRSQQAMSAFNYFHGDCTYSEYCQSDIKGNTSSLESWKQLWLKLYGTAMQIDSRKVITMSQFSVGDIVHGANLAAIQSGYVKGCCMQWEISWSVPTILSWKEVWFIYYAKIEHGITKWSAIQPQYNYADASILYAFISKLAYEERSDQYRVFSVITYSAQDGPVTDGQSIDSNLDCKVICALCQLILNEFKILWQLHTLVFLAGHELVMAPVPACRQLLLFQCYFGRVNPVLQWGNSEYHSAFTYTHMASSGNLPVGISLSCASCYPFSAKILACFITVPIWVALDCIYEQ